MERVQGGKILIETSGKYRTPREVLTDGEPARLRVWANQLRGTRLANEIKPALAQAVASKDFALVDKCRNLFDQVVGSEKAVGLLIAEAEKLLLPHRTVAVEEAEAVA